jgi:fluoride exporter
MASLTFRTHSPPSPGFSRCRRTPTRAAPTGARARFVTAHFLHGRLPWGTMLVNVVGGALTTYSAFAVQAHERRLRGGLVVVLLTVPPALAACALGHALGQA